MAWVEKYRIEHKDERGVLWTRKIYEDAFGGSLTNLTATGMPLVPELLADSDDLFEPIHETNCKSEVFSSTNFALADLYATEDMHFKVEDYYGATLYFVGYVNCGDFAEPYEDVPYPVLVNASCGLVFLKDIKYDDSGIPYTGRKLESQIILDILAKIGYTEFKEYINIYEESMDDGTGDSPFDQVKIDVDVFEGMYCYEVLQELLKKYGACIKQKNGIFCINRVVEMTGATVYGRYFTAATTKTSISLTPQKYISRAAHSSDMKQVPGGIVMIQDPAKKVTIFQDYGYRDSWIRNWQFSPDKWSGGGIAVWDAENWTREAIAVGEIYPIGAASPESEGVVLTGVNNYPTLDHYIYQSFGDFVVLESSVMCLEFEYQWFNRSGATRTDQSAYFRLANNAGTVYFKKTDFSYAIWEAGAAVDQVITQDVADGDSGWITYRKLIPTGVDAVGPYTIRFYAPDDTYAISFGIRNVKIVVTNDTITVKRVFRYIYAEHWPFKWIRRHVEPYYKFYNEKPNIIEHKWEKTNAINGKEKEHDMILGDCPKTGDAGTGIDNNLEQFKGSLAAYITTKHQRVDTVTLTGTGGTANITCDGITRLATWDTDLPTTAENFAADYYADYPGITLSSDGDDVIFTCDTAGEDFTGSTAIVNVTPNLAGTVATTQVANTYATDYTTDWNTRGGSESKQLLDIISDEMKAQFARPRQLIQMALHDCGVAAPVFDVLGCYEDDVNKIGGNNRKFIVSRGTFNIKFRRLDIDLIEVIYT